MPDFKTIEPAEFEKIAETSLDKIYSELIDNYINFLANIKIIEHKYIDLEYIATILASQIINITALSGLRELDKSYLYKIVRILPIKFNNIIREIINTNDNLILVGSKEEAIKIINKYQNEFRSMITIYGLNVKKLNISVEKLATILLLHLVIVTLMNNDFWEQIVKITNSILNKKDYDIYFKYISSYLIK